MKKKKEDEDEDWRSSAKSVTEVRAVLPLKKKIIAVKKLKMKP